LKKPLGICPNAHFSTRQLMFKIAKAQT